MLRRLLLLSVASLFLVNAAFAGPNQDALKELQNVISSESHPSDKSLSASPFSQSLSPGKMWTLRQLLHAIPVNEETVVINTLPGYEIHDTTEVNAEEVARLFLPVATALLALDGDGSRENQRALQSAIHTFENALVQLPDVNEVEGDEDSITQGGQQNSEDEYSNSLEEDDLVNNQSEDEGFLFDMDDDNDVRVQLEGSPGIMDAEYPLTRQAAWATLDVAGCGFPF